MPSTCQVSDVACSTLGACSPKHPAQRWIAFQDTGPGPSARWLHAMASDGTRVFVLGGVLSADAQADETKRIHVLDTSMYFLFVIHLDGL